MGSRGAFNPSYGRTGGIPLNQRDYSCVGTLGRIKIIQCDKKTNNPTTTYSNTSNTTYYSFSKENNRIEWRKRSIPTHSGWLYPLTFDAGKGLKEA